MKPLSLLDVAAARMALGGISLATLYRLFEDGQLRRVKVRGRTFVRQDDIDALIESSTYRGSVTA